MTQFLLQLLGKHVERGGHITNAHWDLSGGISWVLFALLAALAVALAVYLYRLAAEFVRGPRRWVLTGLRCAFLVMLLLLLKRPIWRFTLETTVPRSLILLADTSTSMSIKDPRSDAADVKRCAIALGLIDAAGGLDQPITPEDANRASSVPRMDVLKGVLANKKIDLLNRLAREYELKLYSFPERPQTMDQALSATQPAVVVMEDKHATTGPSDGSGNPPAAEAQARAAREWAGRLAAWSPVTPIGDGIRTVINQTRGQPLAGIVLLSDFGNNAGSDPMMAARIARQENVPVYTYGVGIAAPKDIIVLNLFAPEVVFAKDEVPVQVRLRAQNLAGESGTLVLSLGSEQAEAQEVRFTGEEQVVEMKLVPQKKGDYDLSASIAPRPDEAEARNNQKQKRVKVIDDKIRVLMIEQFPRWEFKYLQQQMMRDRRVDLKTWLLEGDKGIAKGEASPYVAEFPPTRADLNDKYDVVIFGDVNPKAITPEQMKMLQEFVTVAGGGFIMVAGKQHAPHEYAGTPIEKMLPVELDFGRSITTGNPKAQVFDKPIRMELTSTGLRNGMLRLSDKATENVEKWKRLPPIFWDARVARAKPAAEVLLVDPDPAKASRFGKMPVFALHQYGLGQVLFAGTDNTWRWRRNEGDQFFITLWGQIIQRMAMPHMLGSKRTQLSKDKDEYVVGETVTMYARLYDTTYEPVAAPVVRGYYVGGTDDATRTQREVLLRPVPDQPGMYKGEFHVSAPGGYKFYVDKPGDPDVREAFNVAEPTVEYGDTAMNIQLAKDIAQTTGGQFFREEDIARLPDMLRAKTEKISFPMEIEVWSTKLYFLLLLGIVTAEWVLRKSVQLK